MIWAIVSAAIWLVGALGLTVYAAGDGDTPVYSVILLWPLYLIAQAAALPFRAAEWLGRKLLPPKY